MNFELTLKGFNPEYPQTDDQVKWVAAPTKQSLDNFLSVYNLKDKLAEEPRILRSPSIESNVDAAMIEVDLILDENGNVLRQRNDPKEWKTFRSLELTYNVKFKTLVILDESTSFDEALCEIDVPENGDNEYIPNSFEVARIEDGYGNEVKAAELNSNQCL